ncbi:lysophospholipid acyltransferase family protein [Marinibacterium profundimaris]|uniref:Acyl-phosphate glycerol 3-phosphate acyltransferase n=1 Tax=Marinibacterium profundimaris TaxID=1679460 RepID=A0A225NQZ4_9RHOB|nr:lysophospholipid acyltransferase family protein [Marinibacterium profundimaris]OWU77292.1 acyl-phosphate glycerol 3-phosphate acyltransferase [Marinibacterium profundimaris]
MSPTWQADTPPDPVRIPPLGWLLVLVRGVPLALLVFGGLALLLALRLIERPIHGLHRPWTPRITQIVCRNALRIMGITFTNRGEVMPHHGALVANHSSWLDIFTLNAQQRVYFVSKAEVAGWPGIGWLARATGTVFIERDRRQARDHNRLFEDRLGAGHKLLFFPEGTSTDGLRVLPFRTTLFAAFFAEPLRDTTWIQPVTVRYRAPRGRPARFYGWWGEMDFGTDLLKILAQSPQGGVEVIHGTPLRVADFPDRKALARAAEEAVRAGLADAPGDSRAGA